MCILRINTGSSQHNRDGCAPQAGGEAARGIGSTALLPFTHLWREQGLKFHSSSAKNNVYDHKACFISGDCESAAGLLWESRGELFRKGSSG